MTGPRSQIERDDYVLMLLDISRAHVHSPLARVVFVSQDGKDGHAGQFAVKELARRMQQPNTKNMQAFGAIPERKSEVFDRPWQTS